MIAGDLAEAIESASVVALDDSASIEKTSICLFVGLLEVARSAADNRWRATADALVRGDWGATLRAGTEVDDIRLAAAHAFLMHAELRDDAFLTAFHPGQLAISSALAAAQKRGTNGRQLLRAIGRGYEVGCAVAELALPAIASNGWRVTSVIAPLVSAAVVAGLSSDDPEVSISAIRLAATVAGGGLHAVQSGSEWRIQPALALAAGFMAADASAAGYRAAEGALESEFGLLPLVSGPLATTILASRATARIADVNFKRFSAPMYAQGALDACWQIRGDFSPSDLVSLEIAVAPFAGAYADSSAAPQSVGNVASAVALARNALSGGFRELAVEQIEIVYEPRLGDSDGAATATTRDGSRYSAVGSAETSDWSFDAALDFYVGDFPRTATGLARAIRELDANPDPGALHRAFAECVDEAKALSTATSPIRRTD